MIVKNAMMSRMPKRLCVLLKLFSQVVDAEARWIKKGGKSVFGYKQHILVDNNGLVMAVETTAANQHDSKRC